MMLTGHNSFTEAGRATRVRVEARPCSNASFGLNACPNTPVISNMHLEGFGISSVKSAQQQTLTYSLSMR